MNLHVVSIEYTLQRPNPSLGDTAMSPLFNRVSYKCPTLHIFGYVRPREGAEGRVSGSLSGEQMQDKLQQYSACAHVHGTYPYFFVQRHDSRISAVQFGTQLEAVASKTVKHRDSQSALKRDFHGEKQLIHHVEVVWLFPFYGFSAKRQPFFKVYVIDPATVPSLLQLLYCTKEVGGREWLVCEGHSSFHFQFMVDYGAKGMAPFLIPSCVARGPLPVELKWDQLGITSIRNEDETPRLSCAQIEVDVVASSLRLRNTNIEAGENILAARRNVLQYFSDFGVDSAALRGCLSGPNERCFTVGDHQRYDLTAECLRKRAAEYIVMRAGRDMGVHQDALCDSGGSTQQLLSDLQRRVGEPVDALLPPSQSSYSQPGVNSGDMGNCGPSTLEDTYLPLNTSQQGPCEDEEMRPVDSNISRASTPTHVMDRGYLETEYEGYQDIVLSFTSTSSDSYDQSNIDDVSDSINKTKGNTLNDADDMRTGFDEQVACSRDSLSVGDTVAINPDSSTDVNKDSDCLFARVTELHSTTARLQWYVTLSETHLADCQDGLERRGCWLGKRLTLGDRSSPVTDFHEEVLLGDVEDVNPLSVIKYGLRIKVYHTYQSFIRHIEDCGTTSEGCRTGVRALLCRYNYHVRERRLSAIVPPDDEMHVTMPTSLLSLLPTPSTVNIKEANLLEEAADDDGDAELFQKRSPSKSCERSAKCSTSPLSSTPIRSLGNDMRSEQREDRKPEGLNRSVSKVARESVQSQVSLLQSLTTRSSLSPRCQASAARSVVVVSSGEMQSSLPLTTSSVECVDKCGDEMFWEFKTRGSWLRPSHIIGDIPRNFLWTYNHQRKQVRVSGVTWPSTAPVPLSPPLPPQPKSTATGWPRNSIPFLTHIAKSQDLPRAESEQTAQHGRGSRRAGTRNICGSQKDITRIPCAFRIVVLEAFIHRRCGVQHVEEEYLLAVGLGRTASSEESVGVRLLCVASESQVSCAAAHALQRFSGSVELVYVPSERDLLLCVMRELRNYDPDIVMSWEVGRGGVGLFALRYQALLQRSFSNDFSRLTTDDSFLDVGDLGNATGLGQGPGDTINEEPCGDGDENALLSTTSSLQTPSSASPSSESSSFSTCGGATTAKMDAGMPVSGNAAVAGRVTVGDMTRQLSRRFGGNPRAAGRFIIDLSKYLRKALQLPSYTLQMVYLKLFNKTIPFFTDIALTKMYSCGDPGTRHVFLSVLLTRVVAQHRIAQHLQFYSRTSEFARMFGILFNEVVTRGSQYHVEATLYRMAKPMGFTMLSPPTSVVHQQPRLQSMPLTMEPRSGFYKDDPVVVLDFRSLYPSIVIAYNICYTTCLGIVGKRNYGRLGVLTSYRQDDPLILSLLDRDESRNAASCTDGDEGDDTSKWSHSVTFAPNGTMFLTRETREGVLPQMLRVLLDTRVDVKAAIERVAKPHGDVYMQQILEKQQLALKMLANTTYGYTAASFTGRMPCADVADAIVMLGRQTLERAIMLINGHPTWKAEVVYGDTDSVFVRLPGRSKEEAFAFGEEIAKEVTAVNPFPVCLQLEKVLKPCLLLVKKRYVGYAYFKPDQKEPQFLDKGIETVRRDQCAATSRLAAKMLHLLFSGADSAVLRRCFYEELSKLQRGDCSPADCIFRRAVKLGRYKSGTELPPAAHLAMQLIDGDVMKVPYWGERVPFVVVKKPESSRLRDRVVHPQRLLSATEHFVIDSEYYIKRNIIPTLERMFYLNGISFTRWYQEMPRRRTYRNYFDLSLSTFSSVSSKRQRDSDKPSPVDARRGEGSGHGDGIAKGINMHTSKGRGDVDAPRGGRSRRADKITLDHFFQPSLCAVCLVNSSKTTSPSPPVCKECLDKPSATMLRVVGRRCRVERRLHLVKTACLRCIGTCGERGGQGFLGGQQADMEDMNFVIPHELAITGSCAGGDRVRGAMSSVGAQAQLRRQPVRNNECWEEDVRCVSIDCHVSFEKKRLESLYPQLISLENFLSSVLSQGSIG